MSIKIKTILESELSQKELQEIKILHAECFADVSHEEIEEDFIAKSFACIIAYKNGAVVGTLRLFKRLNDFEGRKFTLGGLGGVCVTQKERGQGIASKMCQGGLIKLKEEGCDVACLNVDLIKKVYGLYEKLGFKFMEREFSFTNSKGVKKYDTGTMFIPLNSKEVYDLIMRSKETFHYGVGYW